MTQIILHTDTSSWGTIAALAGIGAAASIMAGMSALLTATLCALVAVGIAGALGKAA